MSKPPYDASRPIKPLRLKSTEEQHIEVLEAKVERLTEHIRERERVWSERERVAIKEAKRLNEALAKYEADDVRYLKRVAALEAEVERLRDVQKALVRDNRDKTNAVRELQAALADVLRSYEAYVLLCDPPEKLDEYDEMMLPAWRRAASLVPGFDPKAPGAWVQEPTALEEA